LIKKSWDTLLSKKRQRDTTTSFLQFRNEFDKDYERIIYSSSLRRLQDKAQVFPLQESDFIRTRLTHSLEVASLGRSMAWNIGTWLLEKGELKDFWQVKELASLLEVACLVHDLGNPPFGHYGEDVIRKWFKVWFSTPQFEEIEGRFSKVGLGLSEQQKNDFCFFEGNAQGIRILAKLQFLNDQYGANFTYGTLATLIKYPWPSDHKNAKTKKKIGYFFSEKDLFDDIQKEVGIGPHRHPATYILEAADDIAYLTADIEDGVKKKVIPWEEIYYSDLKPFLEKSYPKQLERLEEYRSQGQKNKVPDKDVVNVQNFKVMAQGIFITAVTNVYKECYDAIMSGEFDGDLLDASPAKELKELLQRISRTYCFSASEVLTLELIGDRVISDLLSLFVNAVLEVDNESKTKSKEQKLYSLISQNFRHIQKLDEQGVPTVDINKLTLYNRLLLVTDFISGMTDSYAVNLHQKLLGVKLP